MKSMKSVISSSNLFIKLGIFVTGIVTGLDSSLRQLLAQLLLFLLYLLCESSLYPLLIKALRRILPFLAGYWLFTALLNQPFQDSVYFTFQILYLLTVTIVVLGNVQLSNVASDSAWFRRLKSLNALLYYFVATFMFMKSFIANYASLKANSPNNALLTLIPEVLHLVSADSSEVQSQVRHILATPARAHQPFRMADFSALVFLALLVIIHSI